MVTTESGARERASSEAAGFWSIQKMSAGKQATAKQAFVFT